MLNRTCTAILCFCLPVSIETTLAETPATTPETPAAVTTEVEKTTRKATVVNAQYQQQALSDEQKADEIVWLEPTYPNMDKPARVLALAQKHRTAQAQGAVLIVPDHGQHPDWPESVSPLRQSLPDYGWYTLSITMPNPSSGTIPERQLDAKALESVDLTEQIKSSLLGGARAQKPNVENIPTETTQTPTEPTTPVEPAQTSSAPTENTVSDPVDIDLQDKTTSTEQRGSYGAWAQANLQAGIAHLQGKGFLNIVLIVLGKNSEAALAWLKPNAPQMSKGGFALILIDPRFSVTGQSFWQDRLGADFAAPVLDIVNSVDLEARDQSEQRRSGANVAGMQGYQQVRLLTSGDGAAQKNLLRRIQQWMGIHAPGMSATQFKKKSR